MVTGRLIIERTFNDWSNIDIMDYISWVNIICYKSNNTLKYKTHITQENKDGSLSVYTTLQFYCECVESATQREKWYTVMKSLNDTLIFDVGVLRDLIIKEENDELIKQPVE